jgi:hypothetical protein
MLTDNQITDLARPLAGILEEFYQDPKNQEEFDKWLRNVEKRNSTKTSS